MSILKITMNQITQNEATRTLAPANTVALVVGSQGKGVFLAIC